MFSALVAAVLLMTGMVLINILVNTEDKLGGEVYIMLNSYQLSDAAALARSDALQGFNYSFREELETHLTVRENELDTKDGFPLIKTYMVDSSGNFDWEDFKREFENVLLLKDTGSGNNEFKSVIDFVSGRTISQFHDGRYGRYYVSLSERGDTAKQKMNTAIGRAMDNYQAEGKPFLEVIDCDEFSCPTGTFYFNIPLDEMEEADYEALPRIIVKDLITGEEIKISVLPRSRLKIYIPLRFFRAIHEAIDNAKIMKQYEEQYLETGAMLGFCDHGSCVPRENPKNGTSGAWTDNCIGLTSSDVTQLLDTSECVANSCAGITNYPTKGDTVGRTALNGFARDIICDKAITQNIGDPFIGDFVNYNNIPGLSGSGISGIVTIVNCPFNRINVTSPSTPTKTIEGGGSGQLYCSKTKQVDSQVLFEETNPLYIVSGEKNYYKIGITGKEYNPLSWGNLETCRNGSDMDKECTPVP